MCSHTQTKPKCSFLERGPNPRPVDKKDLVSSLGFPSSFSLCFGCFLWGSCRCSRSLWFGGRFSLGLRPLNLIPSLRPITLHSGSLKITGPLTSEEWGPLLFILCQSGLQWKRELRSRLDTGFQQDAFHRPNLRFVYIFG